ncbi:MAG: GAF domain-containing protein [Vulcanimicrobiota bacterium]
MARLPRRRRQAKGGLGDSETPALYSPADEDSRAQALGTLGLLDTPPEERFDRICRLAQQVMQAPATYISLIDRQRQWFKSTCGMGEVQETPREGTFCDYAIRRSRPTVVLNATEDPLFAKSPYVTEGPKVRFYAGYPLVVGGQRVGTLCALDFEPRTEVSPEQMEQLGDLARMAETELTRPPADPPGDGAWREITVLRANLPGSAALFEQLEAGLVLAILNLYLEGFIGLIHHYGGTVDDLCGDTLRVAFGLEPQADHPLRAAACALAMQAAMVDLNQALAQRNLPPLACAISLHTAEVVVGSLGSHGLWKPSWVGDALALSDRVQPLVAGGQILASETTIEALGPLAQLGDELELDPLPFYPLKGLREAL